MEKCIFNKIKYFRFLFSDKKAISYWIFIAFMFVVFTFISYLKSARTDVFWSIPLFFLIYIGVYTASYLKYDMFFKLMKVLMTNGIDMRKGICKVYLMPEKLSVSPPLQNFNTKVKLNSYSEICFYLQTKGFILLFYPIREMGLFKFYTSPVFINNDGVIPLYLNAFRLNVTTFKNIGKKGDRIEIRFNNEDYIYLADCEKVFSNSFEDNKTELSE